MEENTARKNEIEEIEFVDEAVETSEDSNSGAFVAGIVGGFLAYGIVTGAKKLATFVTTKLQERKQKRNNDVIDADYTDVETEQDSSDEEENK